MTKFAAAALVAIVSLTGCGASYGVAAPKAPTKVQAKWTPGDFELPPNTSIRYVAPFAGTVTKVAKGPEGLKIVTIETVAGADDFAYTGPLMINAFAFEPGAAAIKVGVKLRGNAQYPFVNTKTNQWVNLPKQRLPQATDLELN